MPTTTTTITTTSGAATTTQTTTVTTAEEAVPPPSARAAEPAAQKKPILKDGVAVNDSIYPKVGVPADPEGITKEWLTDCLVSRKIIAANNCVASMESTQIGEGRGYANVSHGCTTRLVP